MKNVVAWVIMGLVVSSFVVGPQNNKEMTGPSVDLTYTSQLHIPGDAK